MGTCFWLPGDFLLGMSEALGFEGDYRASGLRLGSLGVQLNVYTVNDCTMASESGIMTVLWLRITADSGDHLRCVELSGDGVGGLGNGRGESLDENLLCMSVGLCIVGANYVCVICSRPMTGLQAVVLS